MQMSEREIMRTRALAVLDQQSAEADERLDQMIAVIRGDLAEYDRIKVMAATAARAADRGVAFSAVMLAHAVIRLAEQEPTP